MGSDLYFFEQCEMRKVPRRYRKLPEELPEKLRFAHLNPKVQALLASKERGAKVDNEDPFGDGLGKKSLLPDINAAFTNVRNQFDSVLSNDEDSQRYLFEEAKISASSILHQLSQIIYRYEDLYKHIPKSLEYHLMSGYNEFTSDVVVVPREWQTQEMKDQYNAKLQQETLQSEEDVSDTEAPTGRTKSRMGTDRSSSDLKSNLRRSKALMGSIETVNELDLKMESRQGKRSDSRMSATSVMRQHLGVDTMSRVGSRRKGSISGPSPSIIRGRRDNDLFSLIAETPDPRSTVLGGPLSNYAMQTINFQLSNSAFEDKGWIMLKGRQEEVDQNQILEYCVQRLQESLRSITEQTTKEVEQGHDKPVVLRYYGDAKKETLLKYRKSPSKSGQSIVHRGGKPKIPTIVDERNEGKKLMHAQHIDGSAVLYYPSGRPALIHSAAGFGRPGFYTIVYEDGLDSRMIACFTPSGRGVCYHENGVVSFLATEKGGHLAEENGKLIRKWTWPKANVKITEPLSLQVNGQVCFRCVGQSQMTVSFSCQRETARFNVGHNPDIEARAIEEGDQLLTGLTFSSKAARDLMRIFAPNKKRKKTRKKTLETSPSTQQVTIDEESTPLPKSPLPHYIRRTSRLLGFRPRKASVSLGAGKKPNDEEGQLETESENSSSEVRGSDPDVKNTVQRKRFSINHSIIEEDKKSGMLEKQGCYTRRQGKIRSIGHDRRMSLIHEEGKILDGKSKTKVEQMEKTVSDSKKKLTWPGSKSFVIDNDLAVKPSKSSLKKMPTSKSDIHPNLPSKQGSGSRLKKPEEGLQNKIRKRVQSAKPFLVSDSLAYSRKNTRKEEKPEPRSVPEISKESNLFIQTEAYPERWKYRYIARKTEEPRPMKTSVLNKAGKQVKLVNRMLQKNILNIGNDRSTKCRSAKEKSSSEMVEIKERPKSALPHLTRPQFKEMTYSIALPTVDEREKQEVDSAAEKRGTAQMNKDLFKEGNSFIIPEIDVTGCTEQCSDGSYGVPILGTAKPTELSASEITIHETNSAVETSQSDLTQHPRANEDEAKSPSKFDLYSVTRRFSNQPRDTECDDERKAQKYMRPRGREVSTIMQSILEYRKKTLAKKGIILSSESESETDSESDTHTSKSQSSEILKLLQDFPDKVSYELEADKDLAKLQRKARILVDDWMEHYRLAVGLIPAELLTVRDSPQRYSIQGRNTKSARMSDQGLLIRRAILGVDSTDWEETPRKKMRIPSAPLAGLGGEIDEDLAARIASQQQQQQPESSEEKDAGSGDGTVTPSAMVIINRMAETASRRSARSRATSARTMSPTRQQTTLTNVGADRVPSATPQGGRSHCPLVIRQQKLGYDSPSCRCSRHYIPNIMDIELDDFVEKDCPEEQLIVIMVVSSLKGIKGQHGEQVDYSFYMDRKGHPYRKVFPGITKAEEMVNEIYQNQNRNRTRPCVQSRSDMFRVFKYDINSAAEMSNHTQPILLTRHNVVPGMFLIYSEGKLLFCDHIFNGYGNTRKDFKKQIMKSRHDAIQGFSLPKDFRFSPSKGRHGLRSGWGGEIGGAGVDEFSSRGTIVDETLQPIHRPTSDGSERSKELHLDAVKRLKNQFFRYHLQTAPQHRILGKPEFRNVKMFQRIGPLPATQAKPKAISTSYRE